MERIGLGIKSIQGICQDMNVLLRYCLTGTHQDKTRWIEQQ